MTHFGDTFITIATRMTELVTPISLSLPTYCPIRTFYECLLPFWSTVGTVNSSCLRIRMGAYLPRTLRLGYHAANLAAATSAQIAKAWARAVLNSAMGR